MNLFFTFSLFACITICFSCSQGNKSATAGNLNETNSTADSITKMESNLDSAGQQIYLDNCVSCHGVDGKQKHQEAKDLSVSTLSMDECIKVISSAQTISSKLHSPRFVNYLSENDIKEVAQYIQVLRTH